MFCQGFEGCLEVFVLSLEIRSTLEAWKQVGLSCLWVVQVGLVAFRLSRWARPSGFWVLGGSFGSSESMHGPGLQTLADLS